MRRRDRRLLLIGAAGVTLAGAVALASVALRDTAAYFYSPAQAKAENVSSGAARVGGLVAAGTVIRSEGGRVDFVVTDNQADLKVSYVGVLPDLFREGQGVVAEGRFVAPGEFKADRILAKHDETYMPKEVADALKASGEWRPAPPPIGNMARPS